MTLKADIGHACVLDLSFVYQRIAMIVDVTGLHEGA